MGGLLYNFSGRWCMGCRIDHVVVVLCMDVGWSTDFGMVLEC